MLLFFSSLFNNFNYIIKCSTARVKVANAVILLDGEI